MGLKERIPFTLKGNVLGYLN